VLAEGLGADQTKIQGDEQLLLGMSAADRDATLLH
jgi:hypothetical protein